MQQSLKKHKSSCQLVKLAHCEYQHKSQRGLGYNYNHYCDYQFSKDSHEETNAKTT